MRDVLFSVYLWLLLLLLLLLQQSSAFQASFSVAVVVFSKTTTTTTTTTTSRKVLSNTLPTTRMRRPQQQQLTLTRLCMSYPSPSPQFDMTKPVFDIYTLRGVRGDALAKYNSLNQSEPLRINLSLFLAFISASFPFLNSDNNDILSDLLAVDGGGVNNYNLDIIPAWPLCLLSAAAFTANFVRECRRRNRQLIRLEKELEALSLTVRLPQNVWADSLYQNQATSIRQVQSTSSSSFTTLRVLALYGTASHLRQALLQLLALSQRLVQSETIVVPVASDGSSEPEWGLDLRQIRSKGPWLAAPGDVQEWKNYFLGLGGSGTSRGRGQSLDGASAAATTAVATTTFKWFGLSATGRSFGSGQGETLPSWIQLLGQHLRPTVLLDADYDELLLLDENNKDNNDTKTTIASTSEKDDTTAIMTQLRGFYRALTSGDEAAMNQMFARDVGSPLVSEIIQQGGRLDTWTMCLQYGNRPSGMKVANADVTIVGNDCNGPNKTIAYSTVIEFPDLSETSSNLVTTWMGNKNSNRPTLLAQQSWEKRNDGSWKLIQHQTIPWSDVAPAAGTLVCDARGCVSLVRNST